VSHARPSRNLRRRLVVLGVATLALLGPAAPAAADPAGPTHYDARVTGTDPADPDLPLEAEVLGGDAFLVVRAHPGTTVEVPGYEGEPYVRISPDGTVEVNDRSPSRWINDERYETDPAAVDAPADLAVDAPPRWEVVGTDGTYAWHDHRIHWMSPALPGQVDPAAGVVQPVFDWEVPLTVDGEQVRLLGELVWLPGPGPVVPAVLVALGVLAAAGLAWRFPAAVAGTIAAAAVLAGAVGLTKNLGLPTGADGEPFLVILPVLALAATTAGILLARRDAAPTRGQLVAAAAGVPLLVWVVIQAGTLTRPVVPGPLPVGVVRAVLVVALAAGLAGIVTAARTALAATALDADAGPATS
jgi:hypothetical protein